MDGREIILIGTAHVSKKSAEEVKQVIEEEKPDTVCVELCESRYQSITDAERWKNTDIIKIIKEGKSMMLLINLIMSSHQKKLARQFGINPGQEMIQGIESANRVANLVNRAKLWLALAQYNQGEHQKFLATVEEFRLKYRNTEEWKILSRYYEDINYKVKK